MVLVELRDDAPPQQGVVSVVRLERTPSARAVVRALGPEVLDLAVGQRVVVSRLQGITVGENLLLVSGPSAASPVSAVLATEPALYEHACPSCGGTLDYENVCIAGCA